MSHFSQLEKGIIKVESWYSCVRIQEDNLCNSPGIVPVIKKPSINTCELCLLHFISTMFLEKQAHWKCLQNKSMDGLEAGRMKNTVHSSQVTWVYSYIYAWSLIFPHLWSPSEDAMLSGDQDLKPSPSCSASGMFSRGKSAGLISVPQTFVTESLWLEMCKYNDAHLLREQWKSYLKQLFGYQLLGNKYIFNEIKQSGSIDWLRTIAFKYSLVARTVNILFHSISSVGLS